MMSSVRLGNPIQTYSERSNDGTAKDRAVLARMPNSSQAQGHLQAPGGRDRSSTTRIGPERSPNPQYYSGKRPASRAHSSNASRSQSPLGTYRKNLEKRYGGKGASKHSFKSQNGGGNTAQSARGPVSKLMGAPRSQSNLQKLQFKISHEDDAPLLAGEDSDFSEDAKQQALKNANPFVFAGARKHSRKSASHSQQELSQHLKQQAKKERSSNLSVISAKPSKKGAGHLTI